MGFDVMIKGSSLGDSTPTYCQTYTLTGEVSDRCPTVGEVLFYECDPHDVSHQNSELQQVLRELEELIGDYALKDTNHLDSMMVATFGQKETTVGTMQGSYMFEGLKPADVKLVKNAAYSLREVVRYALQEKRDIEVS